MVGMKNWMLWLGWFIYSLLPMLLSACIIIFIMKVDVFNAGYPLIEYANTGVLFVFFVLYCMSAIVFCFFLVALLSAPILAMLVALQIWILSYFVPKYLIDDSTRIPFFTKVSTIIFPNMALHFGYEAISDYEEREIGINWTNLNQPGGGGATDVSMLNVFLMLIFDICFYVILSFYVDAVNPGKYGVPKSYFFPLKWLIEKIRKYKQRVQKYFKCASNEVDIESSDSVHLEDFEEVSKIGIELIRLTKKYGKAVVVDNLSFAIYQNNITVLLGHNGAGKSTTMGMITGMIKKTSGHILIRGRPLNCRFDINETIGLCPQQNLLFSELTVAEHLKFFALLKGRSFCEADREVDDILRELHLVEKKNKNALTLSGGMKRKLCLGMAIIGDSNILILDEPSSGMDPESRRFMWDFLKKWRHNRIILITTHFMEEADAIGDNIVIMNEGKLICSGTPMDLKRKYKTGDSLSVLIQKGADVEQTIKNIIEKGFQNGIELQKIRSSAYEVVFSIASRGPGFSKFLEDLESKENQLGIDHYSIRTTDLEDVFLKTNGDDVVDNSAENSKWLLAENKEVQVNSITELDALCTKKVRVIWSKSQAYFIPFLICLILVSLGTYLSQDADNNVGKGGPSLNLHLSSYGKSAVFFDGSNTFTDKFGRFYEGIVNKEGSEFTQSNNVSNAIVTEAIKNVPYYRHHMIAAAEISGDFDNIQATALYNNFALHSSPISLNIITNALAKTILGEEYSISITNHPLDPINTDSSKNQLSSVKIGLMWLIIMPMGFLFFLGCFIYFPFNEQSTKYKELQFSSGVRPWVYWLSMYIFDLIFYLIVVLVLACLVTFCEPFQGTSEYGCLVGILAFYGISGIPYSYLYSRTKSYSGAYACFIIVQLMIGVVLTVIVYALYETRDEYYVNIANWLKIVFVTLCPQFILTYFGVHFAEKVVKNYNFDHMTMLERLGACNQEDANPCCHGNGTACIQYRNYWTLLQDDFIWVFCGALFYIIIIIARDTYSVRYFFHKTRLRLKRSNREDKEKLVNSEENKDTLKVLKLKKAYGSNTVVDDVKFTLQKGLCMGILGVNGAGKTTTFRILTRDEIQDGGYVQVKGYQIDSDGYSKHLGYCPQNDALNFTLSGRVLLTTMAKLRRVNDIENTVATFLKKFGLDHIADEPCEHYSGGNKRKLSVAMAIIGMPDVILLDEPTNGVDPASRRMLWNLIHQLTESHKKSVLLTSHSMTECEALCNNLKIMKKGTIKREGAISELKKEIHGYSVMIKFNPCVGCDETDGGSTSTVSNGPLPRPSAVDNIITELQDAYCGTVKDKHEGLLHYYINDREGRIRYSRLFNYLENLKEKYLRLIEDYSISEASLEDVFLDVAKPDVVKLDEQRKPPNKKKNKSDSVGDSSTT